MNPLIQPVKVLAVTLFVAAAIATFLFAGSVGSGKTDVVNVADAHSPRLHNDGGDRALASSVDAARPNGQLHTHAYPWAIGPALPGPKSESAGNFLSDPIVSFDGLHVGELPAATIFLWAYASDDSGAVGFDHYVQVVNTAIAVYDKSGNVLAGPVSTATFWQNQPDCGGRPNLERFGRPVRSIRQPMGHRRPGGRDTTGWGPLYGRLTDRGPDGDVPVSTRSRSTTPPMACLGSSAIIRRSVYFPTPTMRPLTQ